MVASDTTQTYHIAVVGYLACGLVLTTSSVNALVYSTNGAKEAAAAGFILLSMVTVSRSDSLFRTRRRLLVQMEQRSVAEASSVITSNKTED